MTSRWILLALACWLLPGRARTPVHAAGRVPEAAGRRRLSDARLVVIAATAVGIGVPLLLGWRIGALADVAVVPTTWAAVGRLTRRRREVPRDEVEQMPFVLDLLAAVLNGGQPLETALGIVAPAAGPWLAGELAQVAALLGLGARPVDAWARIAAEGRLEPVAVTAVRSADSGLRLARGFSALATQLRADSVAAGLARAHRAGVWSLAPLGLCFLPAFVCIGIVPVVIGIGQSLLHGS
jgi:pilus assembly protein TadC